MPEASHENDDEEGADGTRGAGDGVVEPLPSPAAGATLTAGVGPVAEAGDAESTAPGADPDPAGSGR
jgi:hypothetical protein